MCFRGAEARNLPSFGWKKDFIPLIIHCKIIQGQVKKGVKKAFRVINKKDTIFYFPGRSIFLSLIIYCRIILGQVVLEE